MTQTCTGDCLKCSFQQQTYCSAQRTYQLMKNEEALFSHLTVIEGTLASLDAALSKFNGGGIINPFAAPEKEIEEKAQDGGGADNRPPEETTN